MIYWIKAQTLGGAQLPVPANFKGWKGRIVRAVRVLGPYAAIELLLPGGSVIALLLWLYQRRRSEAKFQRPSAISPSRVFTEIYRVGDGAQRQVPLVA